MWYDTLIKMIYFITAEYIWNSTKAVSVMTFLPMNALCRIVEIGCTISEIRADCLYLAGKRCIWNSTKSVSHMTNTNDHAEMVHCFEYVCKALQIKRSTPKSNALCRRRPHYCGNLCAVSTNEPMNVLFRIVEICSCTISEMRADCLYLAGKRCTNERTMSYRRNRLHYLWNTCWLSILCRKKV